MAASGGENLPAEKTTMKTLTRWSPLRELETLQDRLSTLFERAMPRTSGESSFGFTDWTPAVDVSEDEKEYLIKAELPEVKKEDVKVTVEMARSGSPASGSSRRRKRTRSIIASSGLMVHLSGPLLCRRMRKPTRLRRNLRKGC